VGNKCKTFCSTHEGGQHYRRQQRLCCTVYVTAVPANLARTWPLPATDTPVALRAALAIMRVSGRDDNIGDLPRLPPHHAEVLLCGCRKCLAHGLRVWVRGRPPQCWDLLRTRMRANGPVESPTGRVACGTGGWAHGQPTPTCMSDTCLRPCTYPRTYARTHRHARTHAYTHTRQCRDKTCESAASEPLLSSSGTGSAGLGSSSSSSSSPRRSTIWDMATPLRPASSWLARAEPPGWSGRDSGRPCGRRCRGSFGMGAAVPLPHSLCARAARRGAQNRTRSSAPRTRRAPRAYAAVRDVCKRPSNGARGTRGRVPCTRTPQLYPAGVRRVPLLSPVV